MKPVEIYTLPTCGYCGMAKRLLRSKGVDFTEIDLAREPERRAEMTRRSGGGQTVPQVFVDGAPVGGSDDIHALDRAGKLDGMLA